MSLEFLRRLPLFVDLPDGDLSALYATAEPLTLAAGEWLMREGEVGEALYVVLTGGIEITKRSAEQALVLALRGPGEVIGEMALFEQTPRSASGQAVHDSQLLKIGKEAFKHMLRASPTAALALLKTFNTRLQSTEALLRQNEKMAALGTLAAGLAHELNNPAAAVQRSATQLRAALADWDRVTAEVDTLTHNAPQVEIVSALREKISATLPVALDPLTRGDRESELQTWLDEQGVEAAWEIAPNLVSLGWEVKNIVELGRVFPAREVATVVKWVSAGVATYSLLNELAAGAGRIAEIVQAVKAYAYLDQAPVQEVDVHAGLENTLIILRHKLKDGVTVARQFAPDLPRLEAYGSELNQVWTNIIDNAIDAMRGRGQLVLRTSAAHQQVRVEIEDDGSGIPPNIQPRIFDPFFTTKPPGAGTGLGLHIAHSIISRHRGQIHVVSRPGATCFQVVLPIQLQRG